MTGALAWLPDEWDATHRCPRLGSLPCRRTEPHERGHPYLGMDVSDGRHDDGEVEK